MSTGIISTVAGSGSSTFSGDIGAATSAGLNNPLGVAVDTSSNIYIADTFNNCVRKVTISTGIISTYAGSGSTNGAFSGDAGQATSAALNKPAGLCFDSAGNLYIADTFNYRIRKVTSTGIITTIAGNGSPNYSGDNDQATSVTLNIPYGVGVDSAGNVYIGDTINNRIRKVTISTGIITTFAGTGSGAYNGDNGPATSAAVSSPRAISFDSAGTDR